MELLAQQLIEFLESLEVERVLVLARGAARVQVVARVVVGDPSEEQDRFEEQHVRVGILFWMPHKYVFIPNVLRVRADVNLGAVFSHIQEERSINHLRPTRSLPA